MKEKKQNEYIYIMFSKEILHIDIRLQSLIICVVDGFIKGYDETDIECGCCAGLG